MSGTGPVDLAPSLQPLHGNQARAVAPGESVWLSASAGTGKTQVLSARVLRLLLEQRLSVFVLPELPHVHQQAQHGAACPAALEICVHIECEHRLRHMYKVTIATVWRMPHLPPRGYAARPRPCPNWAQARAPGRPPPAAHLRG